MIRLGTTFSGIGAIEHALHRMGEEHQIVFAGDIDDKCKETYFANYNINEDDWHTDITKFDATPYLNRVDLLVGGSPCQPFSYNGKRMGLEDTRGTLFNDYVRIIMQCQPKCFIFENVVGMLNQDKGRTWEIIKAAFKELNYEIHIQQDENGNEQPLLNSADYGIPQKRLRLFLVGIRNDLNLIQSFNFPKKQRLTRFVPDFLEEQVDAKYYLGQKGFEFVTTHPSRAQVGCPIMRCQKRIQQYNWNGDFIFEPLSKVKDNPQIMDRAYVSTWNGQEGVIRKFTPKECLRLMGFSDDFKIIHSNDTTMYNQAGNSIVVDVLMALVDELIKTGIFRV